MKVKAKISEPKEKGDGHKAHIACDLKAKITLDGKSQEFSVNYDLLITVEMIDYAVRLVAGRIAEVASRVAKDGVPAVAA